MVSPGRFAVDKFADALTDDAAAIALLNWYVVSGADLAMGDAPVDRLIPQIPAPTVSESPLPSRSTPADPGSLRTASESASSAEARARSAQTLAALEQEIRAFDDCALKKTAMTTVFADGNPASPLMIVGDAPGGDEDRQGKPFVGATGLLLDRMLKAIGRDRQGTENGVYITNVLPWRPPGNRKPTAQELALCVPFLRRHIALVRPQLLLFLGGAAATALLDTTSGISRLRGRWLEYKDPQEGLNIPVMSTYHPSYLILQPAHKAEAWRDLLTIQARLKEMESGHRSDAGEP